MAPKKKKTQLKPVARGFATTSVPKKVVEEPKKPEVPEVEEPVVDGQSNGSEPTGNIAGADVPAALSEADQVLQTFIDRFQDKVEKEIVRAVKVSPNSCTRFCWTARNLRHTIR